MTYLRSLLGSSGSTRLLRCGADNFMNSSLLIARCIALMRLMLLEAALYNLSTLLVAVSVDRNKRNKIPREILRRMSSRAERQCDDIFLYLHVTRKMVPWCTDQCKQMRVNIAI